MKTLADLQASLVRRHIATETEPLPPACAGVTWIWAANGIFKRGVDAERDLLICVQPHSLAIPGLVKLLPHARFHGCRQLLPSVLLGAISRHAGRAVGLGGGLIEQQYHIALQDGMLRVCVPPQSASASRVAYEVPTGTILVDLHSHHQMRAYFSATDDRDDLGLSVSAVIGRIQTKPEIALRLNVWGHRQTVSARLIFDGTGPFVEVVNAKP